MIDVSSWIARLLPASFRGAPFYIEAADTAFGRRYVPHVFPWRDLPYVEDMGRRPREFAVEAFILGGAYQIQRDTLIAACEQEGPGTLVHGYQGIKTVICTGCTVRETIAEGRMCRISLTFIEAGSAKYPSAEADTTAAVETATETTMAGALSDFAGSFSVAGMPSFVADHAQGVLGKAMDTIGSIRSKIGDVAGFGKFLSVFKDGLPDVLPTPDLLGGNVLRCFSDFNPGSLPISLDAMPGLPDVLASGGLSMGSGLSGVLGKFTDVTAGSDFHLGRMTEMLKVADFGKSLPDVIGGTTQALRMAGNQGAVCTLVRRAGVMEACRSASLVDFSSFDQAAEIKSRLGDALDVELGYV